MRKKSPASAGFFYARTVFFTSAAPGAAVSRYILQGVGEPVMDGDGFGDARYRG
ncbi:hypothetical protein GCM10008098_22280 [Rhodanobacter panaciterrae]|uniref:Uncharacterized protein n=1 Tax=Rhodanobacter panaciterrae TaxID=490572 RepID=A0ABQ2ZXJ9_9GAMM|nr:hypothetical protein [Rhodanobacter panaciterrae]GGY28636.1 hypothetical protein GCM10008098_22280 [Rhodanobacter panaciterrae]